MFCADTSFLVGLFWENDKHHKKAINLLDEIQDNEIYILDIILEESLTLITKRSCNKLAHELLDFLDKNRNFKIVLTNKTECLRFWDLYEEELSYQDIIISGFAVSESLKLLCFDNGMIEFYERLKKEFEENNKNSIIQNISKIMKNNSD